MFRKIFYGIPSPPPRPAEDMDPLLPEIEPNTYLSDIKMLSSNRAWKTFFV